MVRPISNDKLLLLETWSRQGFAVCVEAIFDSLPTSVNEFRARLGLVVNVIQSMDDQAPVFILVCLDLIGRHHLEVHWPFPATGIRTVWRSIVLT